MRHALGIDLGTSGCRAVVIDRAGRVCAEAATPLTAPQTDGARSEQAPEPWWHAVVSVLGSLAGRIDPQTIGAVAVDGTSGTLLLTDAGGTPLAPALMYNDAHCVDEAARIAAIAPTGSIVHGPGSTLARLLYLQGRTDPRQARHALHQADWISARLSGCYGISDENNCLKLGYDPVRRCWPDWLPALGIAADLLPEVVAPGTPIGHLQAPEILALGYPAALRVVAGTTDSVAAFIATGADTPGDAVTSLGSTLVLKVLSDAPISAPQYGIYSHRLGDHWLAGGASNSGGAVLLAFFTVKEIEALTRRIDPEQPSGYDYYPLCRNGERFPYNDPALAPRLAPRPADDACFLHGLLEGIARIEATGYHRLAELGAPAPRRIFSVGGGARNPAWTRIRQRLLGVPLARPRNEQACYGAALLALAALPAD